MLWDPGHRARRHNHKMEKFCPTAGGRQARPHRRKSFAGRRSKVSSSYRASTARIARATIAWTSFFTSVGRRGFRVIKRRRGRRHLAVFGRRRSSRGRGEVRAAARRSRAASRRIRGPRRERTACASIISSLLRVAVRRARSAFVTRGSHEGRRECRPSSPAWRRSGRQFRRGRQCSVAGRRGRFGGGRWGRRPSSRARFMGGSGTIRRDDSARERCFAERGHLDRADVVGRVTGEEWQVRGDRRAVLVGLGARVAVRGSPPRGAGREGWSLPNGCVNGALSVFASAAVRAASRREGRSRGAAAAGGGCRGPAVARWRLRRAADRRAAWRVRSASSRDRLAPRPSARPAATFFAAATTSGDGGVWSTPRPSTRPPPRTAFERRRARGLSSAPRPSARRAAAHQQRLRHGLGDAVP